MAIEMSSSVAAKALHSCMLHRDFSSAKEILKDDGHYDSFEDAWEEVLGQYHALHMELVPIDRDQVRDRKDGGPPYLVRIGSIVFVSAAFAVRDRGLEFFYESDWFPVAEVDEIHEIRLS